MSLRWESVVVDCADPDRVATFWQEALGWRRTHQATDGDLEIIIQPTTGGPADGAGPELLFCRAPEAKAGKNRLHLDLRPGDQSAEVARLEALGATRVDIGQGEESWVVMADPEGNEFCVLRALP